MKTHFGSKRRISGTLMSSLCAAACRAAAQMNPFNEANQRLEEAAELGGGRWNESSRMMQSLLDTSGMTRTRAEGEPSRNNEASHLLRLQSPRRPDLGDQ